MFVSTNDLSQTETQTGSQVIQHFFMLNSAQHEIYLLINIKMPTVVIFMSMKFILLINIKMPPVVGILIFISKINFTLNFVQQENF